MILDIGTIDYSDCLRLQHALVNKRRFGQIPDSVLIVEHPPVFTIGRSGSRKNLLVDEKYLERQSISVIDVDRGGDITFHSPGQLIFYPVIDLRERARDLHRYLRELEEVVIKFLERYGISGTRMNDATGVWFKEEKIASIGIAAKDWVTYHGFSVNINNDTRFFYMINPCGIKGLKVTSLTKALGREVSVSAAKRALVEEYSRIFRIEEMRSLYDFAPAMV